MPGYDDLLMLETQSERLGTLWRSQGQAFLDEQAAELQEDVDRLRDAYLTQVRTEPEPAEHAPRRPLRTMLPKPKPKPKPKRAAQVIDLRETAEPNVEPGWVCSTDGHFLDSAVARCSRCDGVFCHKCILQTTATRGRPLCLECALVLGGVHHKRTVRLGVH